MTDSTPSRPAVFLDRDGTLIDERDYLSDPEEVELVPGAAEALRALRRGGFVLVVVTNQSGIARGLYTEADYRAVAARLEAILESENAPVDATYYCPRHPDFSPDASCRKPSPTMYLQAASDLSLDPARSWFVGDRVSDVLPAQTLGGKGILVRTGYGREEEPACPEGVLVADDLLAASRIILASEPARGTSE